jgi:dihydroorotase
MIIDAHVHILPTRRLKGLSIWLGRVFLNHPMAGKKFSVELIVHELSRNGVEYLFNYVFPMKETETEELNLFNYNLGKKIRSIKPFGSLHIENNAKKSIIDKCVKKYNFFGFKLHPYVQGFSPNDERLFGSYERMERFGTILNIHTGFEDYYPQRETTITLSMIENLVKRFSGLTFILPHMFYPRLSEAVFLLENYENVYVDTTNIFSAIIQDEKRGLKRDREREVLIDTLNKWSKRMVFGTDHPAGMSSADEIFSDLNSFNLKNRITKNLLFDTAYRLIRKNIG